MDGRKSIEELVGQEKSQEKEGAGDIRLNRVNIIFLILTALILTLLLEFGWEVALTVYVVTGFTFSVIFRLGGVDKCIGSR